MQFVDNTLRVSASDLVAFSRCPVVSHLDARVARGELIPPKREDELLELLRSKGMSHERRYLEELEVQGTKVGTVQDPPSEGDDASKEAGFQRAVRDTLVAMDRDHEVIYQATFLETSEDTGFEWRGHVDFLRRVVDENGHDWMPEDTKLAGKVSVNAVIQLLNYADHVARVTGKRPAQVAIVHGRGASEFPRSVFAVADLDAYYRSLKRDFIGELTNPVERYPLPVAHCQVCRWTEHCQDRWEKDDHLSLVARLTSQQVKRMNLAGIDTMTELAGLEPGTPVPGIGSEVVARLSTQARLQVSSKGKDVPDYEIVADAEEGMGLWGLPEPDPGDVFYDIEGDPYVGSQGLEYLHGIGTIDTGSFVFRPDWVDDLQDEKRFLENFIDEIWERRKKFPGMHVYHYAPYETTALKRMVGKHATRVDELDQLLQEERFVDLYRIVSQGVRVGTRSYSIKKLEPLYMPKRDVILDGSLSVIRYEQWLSSGDPEIKQSLIAYNRDDVESTWRLRSWLEERRSELVASGVNLGRPATADPADVPLSALRQQARLLSERLRGTVR